MILCCGEALIDLIPQGDTRVPHVGGAVLNTAVALGRLGEDVAMLTGLSSDDYGRLIEDHGAASHVGFGPSVRSDRPTTLAVVTLVDGQATYDFRDEGSALRDIRPADMAPPPPGTQAIVFGGISLINPPVADSLADYCRRHAGEALIMVDVNIRPGFITDPLTYRARLAAMIAVADILKVSDEDLAWLLPDAGSHADAFAALLQMGPKLIVTTLGADGAEAIMASGLHVRVPSPAAQVADTVGAGDTFNAGLLSGLRRAGRLDKAAFPAVSETELSEALSLGTRAAAVTVARAGPNPPWAQELELEN
ncbi:putative sugar kinase YdjH [Marinibacterium anthonyi]|nr:putative sugar kinase YdjH [Marinibacterium anthonyi]